MSVDPSSEPTRGQRLLRRLDQATVAALTLLALVALAGYWLAHGGLSGRLIEIDRVDPLTIHYQVDLNAADWPEFIALPEIGDTLAHRIVEYRQQNGPFKSVDDLRHVRGFGPKTMERLRPYLLPIKPPQVAEK
jgi:competence protein ComEA